MLKKCCIVILCFFLVSCSVSVNDKFNRLFEISSVCFLHNDIKYSYSVTEREFTVLNGSFEGMRIRVTENGCTAEIDGYVLETQISAFGFLTAFDLLWQSFTAQADNAVISNDGAYVLIIDSSRFLVYYNKDNDKIEKLISETQYGVFEYTLADTE